MITFISKTFDFDAAHRLDKLPPDHKCHGMHGHTYRVEIRIRGKPDDLGMVIDYAEIERWWSPVGLALDHKCLNEIPEAEEIGHPTTENLAAWIWMRICQESRNDARSRGGIRVRVYESATTYAEVDG